MKSGWSTASICGPIAHLFYHGLPSLVSPGRHARARGGSCKGIHLFSLLAWHAFTVIARQVQQFALPRPPWIWIPMFWVTLCPDLRTKSPFFESKCPHLPHGLVRSFRLTAEFRLQSLLTKLAPQEHTRPSRQNIPKLRVLVGYPNFEVAAESQLALSFRLLR